MEPILEVWSDAILKIDRIGKFLSIFFEFFTASTLTLDSALIFFASVLRNFEKNGFVELYMQMQCFIESNLISYRLFPNCLYYQKTFSACEKRDSEREGIREKD
ncbi:MAG TPA: hypothetical protein VIL26_07535 [Clostridia bacterium]